MDAFALLTSMGVGMLSAFGVLGLIGAYVAGQLFLSLIRKGLDLFNR